MKVRVTLVILLAISWVSAQAPYPPSGYRPEGRQFVLPTKPTDNQGFGSGFQPQNRYVPPTNQYGPPESTPTPPPNQYLPGIQPYDFRFNVGQSNTQQQHTVQSDFSSQQASINQQQYGTPHQNVQQQLDQNRQQLDQIKQQLNQNRQQFHAQLQSYLSQSKNVEQQGFIGQSFSDQNNQGNVNNQQQGWAQRPIPRTSASERNYLAPGESNLQNVKQNKNYGKKQASRPQLYETPNPQRNDEESDNNNNNNNQNEDQDFSGNADQNFNVANQNYLPPTTAATTDRRRYPEPTTQRSEEGAEPEPDNETQDPNVAIATAVARGQYYLWQPDGRLQRVVYKTTQTEEDLKNNAYSAKLVYQAVQPITAPIYTYGAPLVTLT